MKLHSTMTAGTHRITGYGPGFVAINEARVEHSVVVLPGQLIADWGPVVFDDITIESFAFLDTVEIEIALLGTGDTQRFPSVDIMAWFTAKRIGLEVMNTPAACRTYNILAAEDRPVGAFLLPTKR